MNKIFCSPIANELFGFLQFKRDLDYGYRRAEFTLREFDRFLIEYVAKNRRWQLGQAAISWLSSKPGRKAVSVSNEAGVLRQFFRYLRRSSTSGTIVEPIWPRLPTESQFVPFFLSKQDILNLLSLCAHLKPDFRAVLYRTLILVLYCTGIRFGEALRLRVRDVDTRSAVLFINTFKRRSRWVPFHRSLSRELGRYLIRRVQYASPDPESRFFVGANRLRLPVNTAHETLSRLFKIAGLKPKNTTRAGPRPYDLRHAFAVHRLSQWYSQGVDLHARLPWLSAYMGHVDIIGTETYLNATPELLALASNRLRRRYNNAERGEHKL